MKKLILSMVLMLSAVWTAEAAKSGLQLGQRIKAVRTTAYTYGTECNGDAPASNALGQPLKAGKVRSAAADWSIYPVGTRFRVVETGQDYVVDDYGSALVGNVSSDNYKWFLATIKTDPWRQLPTGGHFQGEESLIFA